MCTWALVTAWWCVWENSGALRNTPVLPHLTPTSTPPSLLLLLTLPMACCVQAMIARIEEQVGIYQRATNVATAEVQVSDDCEEDR